MRLGKTGVSLGQTVLPFGSRPSERRFNSDARVFGRFVQAFVSSLGADVPQCTALPTDSAASQQPGLVAVMYHIISQYQFVNVVLFRRPMFVSLPVWISSSASSAPPWPNGSSSSLHPSVKFIGTRMVGVCTHRSSCRARIAVHVVGSSFQFCCFGWEPRSTQKQTLSTF